MNAVDTALFHWVNSTATLPVLDTIMPVITNSRVWAVVLAATSLILAARFGRRGRVTVLVLAAALALSDATASQILKPAFGRLRPCRALEDARVLVRCGGRNGFPSNHATNAGAVTAVLGTLYPATLFVVPALAAGVAYSRVYVGVHYPGDVLAGLVFGLGVGAALAHFARRRWLDPDDSA